MTTRRELLKLGALGAAATTLPGLAGAASSLARAARPLDILILGGTGFTGPHQVRYALARGHRVTLFNRGSRSLDWPGEVEQLTGDRDTGDLASLRGRRWDVCIDNPTSIPHWVRDAADVLAGQVDHYVFISTISVYADYAATGIDEDAATQAYEGPDVMAETLAGLRANMALYGPLKAACEREAEKRFPGIATIIRPGLIVGPGDPTDRFTYWPLRIAAGGEVLAPGDGSDPMQVIDARDLAEWTIRMAEQRATGTYNATGPDYTLSTAGMLYGIRAVTTAGAKLTWVSKEFLRENNVAPWGDLPAWVPDDGETAGLGQVDVSRAVAKGLRFRSLAQTAGDTLAWFATQPEERRNRLRPGLTREREAELLAAWHARG